MFLSTDEHPYFIDNTKPLLDNSNTPRKAARQISLLRNLTNKRWLYNKSHCDFFDERRSQIELERGLSLRKITLKEDKLRKSAS